jgi:nucleoprotein TPR
VEGERRRTAALLEDASRAHRAGLDDAVEKEREEARRVEREARQHFAAFEERIVALAAEKDGLAAGARNLDGRVREIEALLEKERMRAATWERRAAETAAALAEKASLLESAGDDSASLRAHLTDLEAVVVAREAELSAAREDAVQKDAEIERIRSLLREAERSHGAEVASAREREASVAESAARLTAAVEDLKAQRQQDLHDIDSLRAERAQSSTEISMLRGYLEDLKEKLREKETELLAAREEGRRESAAEAARILREKRRVEALLQGLETARASASE